MLLVLAMAFARLDQGNDHQVAMHRAQTRLPWCSLSSEGEARLTSPAFTRSVIFDLLILNPAPAMLSTRRDASKAVIASVLASGTESSDSGMRRVWTETLLT